jgi:predicted transcriptional regulator
MIMDSEPTRATAKTVRNILANELGLSRESVREMVQAAIDERLRRFDLTKLIEDQVGITLSSMARDNGYSRNTIRDIVHREVLARVSKQLDITVNVKGRV